jgi:hypothetical protein
LVAKTELGRFRLDSFIMTQVMMYYSRIHSDQINPLIKEAFNLNKSMHDNGIFTWYTPNDNVSQMVPCDLDLVTDL